MKILAGILLFASLSFAQYSPRYNQGKLVGLYNLTDKQNCGLMRFKGPILETAIPDSDIAYFSVKTAKYERDVQVDISKLANVDRTNLFEQILKPRHIVEISGYACGSNGIVDPVSIRVINN